MTSVGGPLAGLLAGSGPLPPGAYLTAGRGGLPRLSVTGLEGAAFLDETEDFAGKRGGAAPLVVRGETGRIYDETHATCVIQDPVAHRRLKIVKTGSEATVVWNPGVARALPDLGGDEWPRFLCVESGNVGRGAVTVAPGVCVIGSPSASAASPGTAPETRFLAGGLPVRYTPPGRDEITRGGREVDAAATPGTRESGGIGRRAGLRIQWAQSLGGSTPPSRTTPRLGQWHGLFDESRDSRARSL